MKNLFFIALMASANIAFAGGTDVGNSGVFAESVNTTIRCTGTSAKGVTIGLQVTMDTVDRVTTVVSIVNESMGIIDYNELSSPSHFVRLGNQGELVLFGFKTFNDGLEENISINWVKGQTALSQLQTGYLPEDQAVKNIICKRISSK